MNDSLITSFHEESLKQLTFKDVKEKAIADFKVPFTDKTLKTEFKRDEWEDLFCSLQLSTLQLLVNDFQNKMYQPAQGGSSERFFVWVFEAVQMLRPMLRTGQFESVKKSLDYIFHYRMRAFLLLVNLQQHLVQLVQRGRGGLILQVWH